MARRASARGLSAASPSRSDGAPEAIALAALSALLLAVRVYASTRVGFGDSEALYAAYALHPQPAYLDHPGLIGVIARLIGGGTAPTPARAHAVTSVLATLVPWGMALLSRAAGATWRRSFIVAIVVALVPEMAIGLFALTPDLLLALLWTGSLASAAIGLRSVPGGTRASVAFAAAGLLAGSAAAAKITGLLLLAALAVSYASREARAHAKTLAPWAGIAAGLVVMAPVVAFEARTGWPMLAHRLDDTQRDAGLSLRNVGALLGGQLAYLSPVTAVLVVLAAREAWRGRRDVVGRLLFASSALPGAVLLPLALWSRVAEPHWIAPALLALGPAAARATAGPSRRLVIAAAAVGATFVVAVHAWVLVPQAVRLAPAASYDGQIDIANELYGWPEIVNVVREELAALSTPGLDDVAVVGPHWVICAQLEADLRGDVHVGCDTPIRDDFDGWWPRDRWRNVEAVVWVTDSRFPAPPDLPLHALSTVRKVRVMRGGRLSRTFVVAVYLRRSRA